MTMVWDADLKSTPKFVLLRLADLGNDHGGSIYPSVKRVAADTGLTTRAVREAYRLLEGCGVLELVAKEDPTRHQPRKYQINLDRLYELSAGRAPPTGNADDLTTPPPECSSPIPGTTFPPPRNVVPPSPERGSSPPRNHVPPNRYKEPLDNREKTLSLDLGDEPPSIEPAVDALFAEWWEAVPLKKAKGAAQRAYRTALKLASPAELLAGIRRYAAEVAGREQRYIAHPASWLNAQRWLDEPARNPGDRNAERSQAATGFRNGFAALAFEDAQRRAGDAAEDPRGWHGPTIDVESTRLDPE